MTNEQKPRDECVEWKGSIQSNGYGMLYICNKGIGAHRVAWALANGRSPKIGMDICHTCDNRKCINPSHLFEGTRKENMQDAVTKGRLNPHNKGKIFCIRGHEFTTDNTYIRTNGKRACKKCHRFLQKRWVDEKRK